MANSLFSVLTILCYLFLSLFSLFLSLFFSLCSLLRLSRTRRRRSGGSGTESWGGTGQHGTGVSETPSRVADEASARVERAPPPVGPTVAVGSTASTIFFVTQKLNSNLDGIGEQGTNPAISG